MGKRWHAQQAMKGNDGQGRMPVAWIRPRWTPSAGSSSKQMGGKLAGGMGGAGLPGSLSGFGEKEI